MSFGLRIKKNDVNKNVEDITDLKEFNFTSARGVLGIRTIDTTQATTDSSGNINVTENHNIGYTPVIVVTVAAYDGTRAVLPAEWHSYYMAPGSQLVEVTEYFNVKIDATKIRIVVHAEQYNHDTFTGSNISGRSYTFNVYYFYNELVETY